MLAAERLQVAARGLDAGVGEPCPLDRVLRRVAVAVVPGGAHDLLVALDGLDVLVEEPGVLGAFFRG